MKTKTLFYMTLTAVMMTLAACSQDNELMDAAPKPAQIEFEIFDGGYGGDATTRVKEEGIRTKFEAGDRCGLYIIDNGKFIAKGVELTAEKGENEEITWKVTKGDISGATENSKYFLFYPYLNIPQEQLQIGDLDTEVFSQYISWYGYELEQDTHDKYTNSDLMTATGTLSKGADNKLKVSFFLKHKMALAVIEVPKTVYKFEGTSIPEYIVPTRVDFKDSKNKPLRMEDGTYRFVFNPEFVKDDIIGIINGSKKFIIPAKKLKEDIAKGTYKTFRIGGGAAGTPIEKDYTLQVGDYLLKDGNLISKDDTETLTAAQKADVAAIVFYTPNISERTTPASLTDDQVMVAEHPNCTNGLAVAVKELNDGNSMVWQTTAESVESFQNSSNFTHANKDKFVSIATFPITKNEGNFTKIYGYQNTQVLFAYNDYCTKNSMTDKIVKPAAAIAGFTDANPAPTGSTGWFIPSAKEMHILCYKDVDNVLDNGKSHTVTRDKVNESLTAVGGVVLGDGYYWSSSETNTAQIDVKFSTAGFYGQIKTMGRLVRCVCAF